MNKTILLFLLATLFLLSAACSQEKKPALTQATIGEKLSPQQHFSQGKPLYDAKKYAEAFPHLEKAAKAGHSDAQMHLGKMYFNGWGVTHNHATAKDWHTKAAAQGNQESIKKLKKMHH